MSRVQTPSNYPSKQTDMNSTKELHRRLAAPGLTQSERAQLRCLLAEKLADTGNYEIALGALAEMWRGVGQCPRLDDLDQEASAEVLLRTGVLSGLLGAARQIPGANEAAKDLIKQSVKSFQSAKNHAKAAKAQMELANCLTREENFAEARAMLQHVIRCEGLETELIAAATIHRAALEISTRRFNEALGIFRESADLFEKTEDLVVRAKYHRDYGLVLKYLSVVEQRQDYSDRALDEFRAAVVAFEQAGLPNQQGEAELNLGIMFGSAGHYRPAHEHFDRAQALFTSLRNKLKLVEIDAARARVLLKQGRISEAEKLIKAATRTLESSDAPLLLAEVLTTDAQIYLHLRDCAEAQLKFERAIDLFEQASDPEAAGQAALSLIEQLGYQLSSQQMGNLLMRASSLLADTQNLDSLKRLAACAFRGLFLIQAIPVPPDWTAFFFRNAVRRYESDLIRIALQQSGGSVTRAAHLLGFRHHQTLVALLNSRHQSLQSARRPIVRRRRSLTVKSRAASAQSRRDEMSDLG
jgi:tetratricopeptide (TPR) repeat protein